MPRTTTERFALVMIERATGRKMSIPEYQLYCVREKISDAEASERIEIPISTYRKWKGENIQMEYRLREEALV